jgi:hypothetical protein
LITGGSTVTVPDSNFTENGKVGTDGESETGAIVVDRSVKASILTLTHCAIQDNHERGVRVQGGNNKLTITRSMVIGNDFGGI